MSSPDSYDEEYEREKADYDGHLADDTQADDQEEGGE